MCSKQQSFLGKDWEKKEVTMKKKLISLLLAAVMTTSLIACGNGTEKVASETTETPAKESTAASADANEAPVEVDYYGFEEPVTVKIGVSYASASDFTFYGAFLLSNK